MWGCEGGRARGLGQQRREVGGGQRVGKGTHRGSDTQGTNKKRGEMDDDKKGRGRRKKATENRNERKKKKQNLPKKDIADGIFFLPPKSL